MTLFNITENIKYYFVVARRGINRYTLIMYFAMNDIGDENVKTLIKAGSDSEKWHLIHKFASAFGFTGIQFGYEYQGAFGLSLANIPDFVCSAFRLTYHLELPRNGLLNADDDVQHWHRMLSDGLDTAKVIGAEDVSFHPPIIAEVSLLPLPQTGELSRRATKAKKRLGGIINEWLPRFQANRITLSLETHVTPGVFIFEGIHDFRDFVLGLPGVGVLVDVSHIHHDGYDVSESISAMEQLSITGLHLSDAIKGKSLADGTHLAIGQGQVDFKSVLERFKDDAVYGALEVRGPAQGIKDSLTRL